MFADSQGLPRSFVGGECQCGAAPFPTASAATLQLWRDIDRFKGRIALGFDPQQCSSRWWFQIFLCVSFLGKWSNFDKYFFRWVETTNCGLCFILWAICHLNQAHLKKGCRKGNPSKLLVIKTREAYELPRCLWVWERRWPDLMI